MRPLILAAILVTELGAQQTVVRFGKLIDGTGKVIRAAAVVSERDRIVSVESGAAIPPNAKVIDLRRYTGLPGLIDAHTHMTYVWDETPGTSPWSQQGSRSTAVTVFLAQT